MKKSIMKSKKEEDGRGNEKVRSGNPLSLQTSHFPRLRFPEFRGEPGWEETELGAVLTEHGLMSDGLSEVHSVSVHKGVINQKEHLGRSFAAADTSNYNLAQPSDVIYTKSPTGDFPFGIVKQNRLGYNVIVSPLYGVFAPITPSLGYILDSYFESPSRTSRYLERLAQKGAKNTIQITNDRFLSGRMYLPSDKDEQRRIADCLSSLDELIAAHAQKLDALRAYKKGLLQQLFPREGETVPRLRFPEFRGSGEWEEKPLGDVADIRTGPFGSTLHQSDYAEVGTPIVTVEHLSDQGLVHKNLPLVSDEDKQRLASYILKAGDIVFSRVGSVDRNSLVSKKEDGWLFSGRLLRIRTKARLVNSEYLSFYFQLETTKEIIKSVAVGQTMASLNTNILSGLTVLITSFVEQRRIADCLTALDTQITAQTAKIESLKQHKRGLMQQILPAPEDN